MGLNPQLEAGTGRHCIAMPTLSGNYVPNYLQAQQYSFHSNAVLAFYCLHAYAVCGSLFTVIPLR